MVTAGYSGTPLPKKLGIKEGHVVALLGAPRSFRETLGNVPDGVRFATKPEGANVVLVFATARRDFDSRYAKARAVIAKDGAIWVCWPKKASGVATDLDFDVVQSTGLASGLVDVKVCAVDEVYSGLKFVYRTKDR